MNDVAHAGQVVLSVVLALGLGACLGFQWNKTHVFNPAWHPHARFHAAQLCLFFAVLSAGALWMTWWAPVSPGIAAAVAAAVPLSFWGGELVALTVPGTDPSPDPDKPNTFRLMGMTVHGNLFFATVMVTLSIVGGVLVGLGAKRRIRAHRRDSNRRKGARR
jgi:hypothetical protein